MKTSSRNITQSLIVLSVFAVSTFVTYGATTTPAGLLKSTPYTLRNTVADSTLSTLTNGAGNTILDGVVASVKAKATEKAGTPFNTALYNAYIDSRLTLLDNLDNQVRSELGSDYAFLFQYVYPRILELKKPSTDINSILDKISTDITGSGTATSTGTGTDDIGGFLDDLLN